MLLIRGAVVCVGFSFIFSLRTVCFEHSDGDYI